MSSGLMSLEPANGSSPAGSSKVLGHAILMAAATARWTAGQLLREREVGMKVETVSCFPENWFSPVLQGPQFFLLSNCRSPRRP